MVDGEDVGETMIANGVTRKAGSFEPDWCASADDSSESSE